MGVAPTSAFFSWGRGLCRGHAPEVAHRLLLRDPRWATQAIVFLLAKSGSEIQSLLKDRNPVCRDTMRLVIILKGSIGSSECTRYRSKALSHTDSLLLQPHEVAMFIVPPFTGEEIQV